MKAVSNALKELGFPRDRRHQEKFVSLGGNPFGDVEEMQAAAADDPAADDRRGRRREDPSSSPGPVKLEVELDGEELHLRRLAARAEAARVPRVARASRRRTPAARASARACACRLLEGEVRMLHNDVLEQEDLADGIRLGCQSLPLTDTVKVSYHSQDQRTVRRRGPLRGRDGPWTAPSASQPRIVLACSRRPPRC